MGEMRDRSLRRHDPDRMYREQGLASPFPRGITHADVDSLTEINGHLLVQEWKHIGEPLSRGQFYTLQHIFERGDHCLAVWFDDEQPVEWHVWKPSTRTSAEFVGVNVHLPTEPTTLSSYHELERRWADWADKGEA